MKKFAVILAGSGVYDGSEIHEATLSLLAIKKAGAEYEIFAPDIEQHHVINHLTGKEMTEKRNVLIEAARIARGKIKPLSQCKADHFDALLFPGGFGVAKNLCDYAFQKTKCSVLPEVEKLIKDMVKLNKPIGALCISPVLLAKTLGKVTLTIGNDPTTAKHIEQMGATHINTGHGDVMIDKQNKVFSTPCYMLDADITDIAEGAENIVNAMLEYC